MADKRSEEGMASVAIIQLSQELIEYILNSKQLEFSDVVHFSATCKSLYKIVNGSSKLWETKLYQRWPFLKEVYWTHKESRNQNIDWIEEIKCNLSCRKKLLYYLSLMSSKHYTKTDIANDDFKEYDSLSCPEKGAHPLSYYFLVDELITFIERPPWTCNLTHRYYALKVLRYLKQCHLIDEWQKFKSLPPKQQTLERGATIIAQWCQPEKRVSYLAISSALDNIAEQVKEELRHTHPTHSIFSVEAKQFTIWRDNIIDDNCWKAKESWQIVNAVCKVLFERLGFHGESSMYYTLENSFIDCVLESRGGIPIILAIIFESVARRLGICCEPVNFPSHFLLRWKETYGPGSENVEKYYIDILHGGQFLTKQSCPLLIGASKCPIKQHNIHEAATAAEVVTKIANMLEVPARLHIVTGDRATRLRSTAELQYMLQPDNHDMVKQLYTIYIPHCLDITNLLFMDMHSPLGQELKSILPILELFLELNNDCEEVVPKERTPDLKYGIGLIMRHKIDEYSSVIVGWDPSFSPTNTLPRDTNIDELDDEGRDQPFYMILVGNGSQRYAAQENLTLARPEWVNHHAIGKYCCKYDGSRYIPNDEVAEKYPKDEEVCKRLVHEYLENQASPDTT